MDLARLAPELVDQEGLADDLLAVVEVARPARGEAHSGVSAGLEDTERPHPERHDEERAPAPVHAEHEQEGEYRNAGGEGGGAQEDTLPAAPRPDVRDAPGRAHRAVRPGFMRPFSARRPPSTAISRASATRCVVGPYV